MLCFAQNYCTIIRKIIATVLPFLSEIKLLFTNKFKQMQRRKLSHSKNIIFLKRNVSISVNRCPFLWWYLELSGSLRLKQLERWECFWSLIARSASGALANGARSASRKVPLLIVRWRHCHS